MTQTDALAEYGLHIIGGCDTPEKCLAEFLPEGTHLFTVDSLAAALDGIPMWRLLDFKEPETSKDYAARIIKAAKEGERE